MSATTFFMTPEDNDLIILRSNIIANPQLDWLLRMYFTDALGKIAHTYTALTKPPVSADFVEERRYLDQIRELKIAQELIEHLLQALTTATE